mgnify:CR=1 FL=1
MVEKNLKDNERPNVLRSVKAIMEAERIERRKTVSRMIKKQNCTKPSDTTYTKNDNF